jgi:hypothetical protein
MSQLGQKATSARQRGTSALPPGVDLSIDRPLRATTGLMQRSKNHLPNDCLVPKLSRRLGIPDQTFWWIWIPRRNPSEHQTDVVAAICLDC